MAALKPRECRGCRQSFAPKSPTQEFCKVACRKAAKPHLKAVVDRECACGCGRTFPVSGKTGQRYFSAACGEKRRTIRHGARAATMAIGDISSASARADLAAESARDPYPEGVERPKTRGECAGVERPCPFVSCRWHLYLDVNPRTGTIKVNFPDRDPLALEHTCALDVADRGEHDLATVGRMVNMSRERVRQLEGGLKRIKPRLKATLAAVGVPGDGAENNGVRRWFGRVEEA